MGTLSTLSASGVLVVGCAGYGGTNLAPGTTGGSPNSDGTTAPGDGVSVTVGDQQILLENDDLGLTYFPDMATIRLGSKPERLLIVAGVSTWLVTGPTLTTLDAATEVLTPTERTGMGELPIDNGYAGISGVHVATDGTLYGYYHAEDHEGFPFLPGTSIPGFYARIGLATSTDNGATWTKQGAIVESSQPKGWEFYEGQADFGAAEPGTVSDPEGEYLYLYYTEHSRIGGRGVQICVARAPLDPSTGVPGEFLKYYEGGFTEAALGGLDTPVLSGQSLNGSDALFGHPVYSEYLGQYVMVFSIFDWQAAGDGMVGQSGIYVAYSYDAVTWSAPEVLVADYSVVVPKESLSWEANILWDDDTGREGWLVYGYSERWGAVHEGDIPHYMVGRRLEFSR